MGEGSGDSTVQVALRCSPLPSPGAEASRTSISSSSGFFSNRTESNGCSNDEILPLLPVFSNSLPVQALVTGINLSVCFAILSHLLFTASYHYPLSKHGFILQFGVAAFFIVNLATELTIIFAHAQRQSRRYPFGFNYDAVQIPPNEDSWNFAQQSFYLFLRAASVLFVHLTHVQFLALLFSTRLEHEDSSYGCSGPSLSSLRACSSATSLPPTRRRHSIRSIPSQSSL
ncbi:hypothetical protein CF319_g5612 [Tilletia indica]|nr:hypothetical protein CF319_g5612 [Tilletia indica]